MVIRKKNRIQQKAELEQKLKRQRDYANESKKLLKQQEKEKYNVVLLSKSFRGKKFSNDEKCLDDLFDKCIKEKIKKKEVCVEETEESLERTKIVEKVAIDLANPNRDCRKFNHKQRAHELFKALDEDENGNISESEFIRGCMSDQAFVKLLMDCSKEFIWGYRNDE